ncbi:hypothetical protein TNCV_4597971 [Trichonephila clavipes]|nr:hypothetical protein TNCV_4597971 [Trichonephila clavipes]
MGRISHAVNSIDSTMLRRVLHELDYRFDVGRVTKKAMIECRIISKLVQVTRTTQSWHYAHKISTPRHYDPDDLRKDVTKSYAPRPPLRESSFDLVSAYGGIDHLTGTYCLP